jgi:hypothetical protein
VIAREIQHECHGTFIGLGQWERPRFWWVSKRFIGKLAGAGNRDTEIMREEPDDSHPPRLIRCVRETATERAGGVLDPLLVGPRSGDELGSRQDWPASFRRHT